MKNSILRFLKFSCLFVFLLSCSPQSKQGETIIEIKDFRSEPLPEPNYALHKYKEVEIRREVLVGESYTIVIYRFEKDSLNQFIPITYEVEEDFKYASYYWESDTVLMVRLHNLDSKNELNFRLSGDLLNKTESHSWRSEILD